MNKRIKHLLAFVMVVILVITAIPIGISTNAKAATNGHTQADAVAWAISQTNNPRDYDGVNGVQCVDLIRMYYVFLGYYQVQGSGCDYATNTIPCSTWKRLSYYSGFIPQPGDVAVWTYASSSSGHVAIVTNADSSGFSVAEFLGSTHTGRTHRYSYSYGTLACFIRPDFNKKTEVAPTYAKISTDKLNYAVDEPVYFTFESDGDLNNLWIYCPDGSVLTYKDVGTSCELAFGMSGFFEGLVQTWNGVGNVSSQRISWYVGKPQYSYITVNKKCFDFNEKIEFTFDTAARGDCNTIWIYKPNGSSEYHQNVSNNFTISFSQAGSYEALVEAWNDIGSCISEKVSFVIGKYEIKYNVSGYKNQTKYFNETIGISSTKPTGKSFTVSYNANGGNVSSSSKTVSQTFTNWNTAANGRGTAYNAGATYSANANITLYAQYANPSIGLLPTPTRSGYVFDGWYTAANGGTKITDSTKVTANTTVYAHWKANSYTVSYNVNGGTGSIASQTKTHNTNLTLTTAKPTGKSFTVSYNANGGTVSTSSKTVSQSFTNWNTAANGSGTAYNAGATYSANANVTLYAQYANSSIGSLPTPTRSGYTFDGWYTAANGGTKITDSTKVTANTTVYAHWTKNAETKAVVKDVKIEHNATVNYKSTYMLSPEITADKGTKYTVKYPSSNTKVATVDENGKIYGAKKGNATITCTVTDSYGNVVTDKCNVNVDYSGAQWFIIIVLFGWIWYI